MSLVFHSIVEQIKAKNSIILVCILSSDGSAPRGKGAMMFCAETGLLAGSIGGGQLEALCIDIALQLLAENRSEIREFTLGQGSAVLPDMLCGGHVRVAFVDLSTDMAHWSLLFEEICTRLETGRDAVLELGSGFGTVAIPAMPRVYVFGGGHCAFALVPILAKIGFRVTLVDDRSAFADSNRFPDAEQVLCGSYAALADTLPVEDKDYLVVMTSGHKNDYEVLERVLRKPFAYAGCMGSQNKAKALNEKLLAAGIPAQTLAAVHTPIGLSIGSQTPEEIAVSIAAELISFRAKTREGESR